ncbi:branched-chain amino acid ABC transporter, permease protein [Aeromicrobium marinum DSM 15272]|uniref:Branched-chain amino acid ABC transporter, permease protein n=1 Tax=Aeromicrobium marinum DSM 15272 TaxID=585531 RepID=E2S991_9ACTN|nr:branched-chain amino acid ABC transporter permease [Aeromicrobium marinum]EFQ83815.1 branched-chain amino acid ABC transporter, permease protein [Aeromicrobium marinum DSM 15272]
MQRRLTALFAAVAILMLVAPTAAFAEESPDPTPSPTASAPAAPATPPDGPSIGVLLLDSTGDGDSKPVPDATLVVTDEDGDEVGEGETGPEGRVFIAVPERGTYTVTIDTDTLPDGVELSGEEESRTVQVVLDGPTFAQFQIGVDAIEAVPFSDRFIEAMVSGIKFGLIVALAALGLSLIFGTTKLTNFSHGELITFGAIATYVANRGLGLPVVFAGIAAVAASALFGYLQDKMLWKPLRNKGVGIIAMMIVSIGFGLFLRNVYQYTFGGSRRSLSEYVSQGRDDYGFVSLAPKEIAIMGIALVTLVVVVTALMTTRLGKAMRAVSDNPALSASSGMRVDGVISSVWVLGTALTGLSGVLLAVNSQVNFLMGFRLLLLVFAAVTLGGLGTIWGALVGSMIIGIMVEVGPLFGVPTSIKEVGALVVLILILLVRPQGILGRRERIG